MNFSQVELETTANQQAKLDFEYGRRRTAFADQFADETDAQMILLVDLAQAALDRLWAGTPAAKALKAARRPYKRRLDRASLGPWLSGTTDRTLRAVLELHDAGRSSACRDELAARVGCHPETIRLALKRLDEVGYVRVTQRPTRTPGRNLPNLITMTAAGFRRLGRPADAAAIEAASAAVRTKKIRPPSESKDSVTTKRGAADRDANRVPAARAAQAPLPTTTARIDETGLIESPTPAGFARQKSSGPTVEAETAQMMPPDRPAIAPGAPQDSSMVWVAQAAARKLTPPENPRDARESPFAVIDRARRQRLSQFHGAAWSRAVEFHGREKALLAAALAMLRPTDVNGAPIKSRAAYLGALLRRPDMDPAASLACMVS